MYRIAVMIPARNEEDNLAATIASTKRAIDFASCEGTFVVVDDGSRDRTVEVAESTGARVVRLPNRGYSALGRPELAATHNAGFDFIERFQDAYDYLFIVGADIRFREDYIARLIAEMNADNRLAIASGSFADDRLAPGAVRGAGRLIRRAFWKEFGARLPEIYFAWESYPLIHANAHGWKTRNFPDIRMATPRPSLRRVDWSCYGRAMRENGSLPSHVIARALKQSAQGHLKAGLSLLRGYIEGSENRYPGELRRYVRHHQLKRALRFAQIPGVSATKFRR